MKDDIQKELGSLAGMGERILLVTRKINALAQDIERLAKNFDQLTELKTIRRADIRFFSQTAYDRASFNGTWPGQISELKEIMQERIRVAIAEKMAEIDRLKEEL